MILISQFLLTFKILGIEPDFSIERDYNRIQCTVEYVRRKLNYY
jgi:hypothetical protein